MITANVYAKAIMGGVMAFLAALTTAITDGTVTGVEWVAIASFTLGALGVVWGVPNTPSLPELPPVMIQPMPLVRAEYDPQHD